MTPWIHNGANAKRGEGRGPVNEGGGLTSHLLRKKRRKRLAKRVAGRKTPGPVGDENRWNKVG